MLTCDIDSAVTSSLLDWSRIWSRTSCSYVSVWIVLTQFAASLIADGNTVAESILSVALGIIIGPVALNWVSPLEWNDGDQEATNYLT